MGAAAVVVHGGHVTADDSMEDGFARWRKAMDQLEPDDATLLKQLNAAMQAGASASAAARQLALETGISRRRLYGLIHHNAAD